MTHTVLFTVYLLWSLPPPPHSPHIPPHGLSILTFSSCAFSWSVSTLVHTLQGDLIHTKDFTSELMNLNLFVLICSSVIGFIFWGSKITADSDCSHEIKRRLLLGRKVMTSLDSILKSKDITLPTKVCLVKAIVFPVVTYRCENWTIKKAEHQRTDAFKLWCWRRLLRVPWTARISNQSILKEISPDIHWKDWCWSWNSNALVTWWEKRTHLKRPWGWERLRAGWKVDDRAWDGWMASPTKWTWVWVNSGGWWYKEAWRAAIHGLQRVRHN